MLEKQKTTANNKLIHSIDYNGTFYQDTFHQQCRHRHDYYALLPVWTLKVLMMGIFIAQISATIRTHRHNMTTQLCTSSHTPGIHYR